MTQPTPEILIRKALEQARGGRNNRGFWLAQQLHANGYMESDAVAVIRQYASNAGGGSREHAYTESEALATLRHEYKQTPKAPWKGGADGASLQAMKVRQAFPTAPPQKREPTPDYHEKIVKYQNQVKRVVSITGTPAADYIVSRGITELLAITAKCGYAPDWGGIGQAVVFPIFDEAGKAIAANGRAINGTEKRTYGPKSDGVFYTPGALQADPIAITEAPFDALTLALAGLPSIAICGVSDLPVWLIKRLGIPTASTPPGFSRKACLAFDNDGAGEAASVRIGAKLPLMRTVRLQPISKDWNEDLKNGLDYVEDWLEATGVIPTKLKGSSVSIPGDVILNRFCKNCGIDRWRYQEMASGYICMECHYVTKMEKR